MRFGDEEVRRVQRLGTHQRRLREPRPTPPPIGTRSKVTPSACMDSTNSMNAGVPITDTVSRMSLHAYFVTGARVGANGMANVVAMKK